MSTSRDPSRRRSYGRASATAIVLFLSVCLLPLGACGRSTSAATGGATPSATAGPPVAKSVTVPGPQLTWNPVALPPGVDPNRGTTSASIAPGNGDVAYVCVAPSSPSDPMARTFITRDRGATWTRGADIAVGAQPPTTNHYYFLQCDIAVDANNPASALIMETWEQVASGATVGLSNYATFDFAAHWQKLAPQPPHFIASRSMASWHGSIYTFGVTQIPGGSDSGIWVSADQMHTWRRLTLPTGLAASAFWVNPSTGALLAIAGTNGSSPQQPYRSDDQGATWTAMATGQTGQESWMVAAPQAGQDWHLCRVPAAVPLPPAHSYQPVTVSCTADGGQTWTPPQPEFVYALGFNPKAGGFWVIQVAGVVAIAVDGAVLATGDRVYRLTPGATVWQDLGPVPGATMAGYPPGTYGVPGAPVYYPTPAGGVLWLPAGSGWMVAAYPAA